MKWPVVKLGMVVDVVSGFGFPRDCQGDKTSVLPFFKVGDMNLPENSREMRQWTNTVSVDVLNRLKARAFPSGTVIFPKIGAAIATGKKRILTCDSTFDNNVMGLVPTDSVQARFLYYWTLTFDFTSISNIGPVPSIRKSTVEDLAFPLPPLSEQQRIVEILDQADALRRKRAEADAKAERVLHAIFIKIFGDPGANSRGLDRIPLRKLLRDNKGALQSGPFGSNLHNADFVDEGTVFVVGIDNVHDTGFQIGRNRRITWEKYQELKKYELEPGDVLITIMGTVGRSCIFPEWIGEAICTKHVYRIQTNQDLLNPEYLCAAIRFSPAVRAQLGSSITGQIVDAVTSKDLKGLLVDVPPIDLQRRFANHKKSLDDAAVGQKDSSTKLDCLFDALLHRAFSGTLTAKWRDDHTKVILAEMEEQAKYLGAFGPQGQRENAARQESLF